MPLGKSVDTTTDLGRSRAVGVPDSLAGLFGTFPTIEVVGLAASALDMSARWSPADWLYWNGLRNVHDQVETVGGVWNPRVYSPTKLDPGGPGELLAGALLHHGLGQREGIVWRVEVSPGSVAFRRRDYVRAAKTAERVVENAYLDHRLRSLHGLDEYKPAPVRSSVRTWSRKSRAKMVERLATLDYGPMVAQGTPAVLTLTYPSAWYDVAPDAATCTKHIAAFRRRYARRWGTQMVAVWKREFQRRGAPHYHFLMVPPAGREFDQWVARTWVSIVGADTCDAAAPVWQPLAVAGQGADCCEGHRHLAAHQSEKVVDRREGTRYTDPRRVGVYFSKHGSYSAKDYQNEAPAEWLEDETAGVGRFWGVWGLKPAVVAVHLEADVATSLVRTARRWHEAQLRGGRVETFRALDGTEARRLTGVPQVVTRTVWRSRDAERLDTTTGELTTVWYQRPTTVRVKPRLLGRAGFMAVNDGPALGAELGRFAARLSVTSEKPGRLPASRLP